MKETIVVTTLVENSVHARGLLAEHGLAFHLQAGPRNLLFDTGQSDLLLHNALKLRLSLANAEAEKAERRALGLPPCEPAASGQLQAANTLNHSPIRKRAISAPGVLNEAPVYGSAFSRGLRVDLPGGITHLLLSGTASVGDDGQTVHPGDFRAQLVADVSQQYGVA